MNIEWAYLPNIRPYIVDGSVWAKQREDGTWVLSALLSDGSNFSGRNEGTRSDITGPIDARRGYHPAQSGIDKWEWRRNFTFADREDFKDATTPRTPIAEWFGTGENQWDSWMLFRKSVLQWELYLISNAGRTIILMEDIAGCVPVSRNGFPAPVGWQVVGQ